MEDMLYMTDWVNPSQVGNKNVTENILFYPSDIDGELLPIARCVCGKEFGNWEYVLGRYDDMAKECPACGRKLYFDIDIKIYEVINNE